MAIFFLNINSFAQIRFSDFAAERRKSRLSRGQKGGGIFKIDYQQTISEVSNTAQELTALINSTNQFVTTVGLDQLLPKIVAAIDKAEDEGQI